RCPARQVVGVVPARLEHQGGQLAAVPGLAHHQDGPVLGHTLHRRPTHQLAERDVDGLLDVAGLPLVRLADVEDLEPGSVRVDLLHVFHGRPQQAPTCAPRDSTACCYRPRNMAEPPAAPPPNRLGRTRAAVRRLAVDITPLRTSRDYRLLWFGELVSTMGRQITVVALPFQVFLLTHSSLAVG